MGGDVLPVTFLAISHFCERKLYLEAVLGMGGRTSTSKDILNEALRYTNRSEPGIIRSITEHVPRQKVASLYLNSNDRALQEAILGSKEALAKEGRSIIATSQRLRKELNARTGIRIDNTLSYLEKHRVFGNDLWWGLTPKYTYAITIADERLGVRMTIDCVENTTAAATPHLYKRQAPPREGVWPSHRTEAAAAMLLLARNNLTVQEAAVHYQGEIRRMPMVPELSEQLAAKVQRAKDILAGTQPPPHTRNKSKCEKCPLREQCYDKAYMDARMQGQTSLAFK